MKKLLLIAITFLMAGMCSGQKNNTYVDTVFFNDGRIYICKITGETSTNIQFNTKDSTGFYEWTVGKYKLKGYVDVDAFTGKIYEKKNFTYKTDTSNVVTVNPKEFILGSMQDSLNYLFMQSSSMQKDISQSAVNFGNIYNNVYSAGKNLKTAGTISIVGIGFGVIGGFCFLMSSYYAKPTANATRSYEHDVQSWATLGAVACGISGACMISIPIGIFSAGKKLKAIR